MDHNKDAQVSFTTEQQEFLNLAKAGRNVLVDACIGSGKTTVIQEACRQLEGKHILYLTYNRRLLLEARDRIKLSYVDVHTYHSFAGTMLNRNGIASSSVREVPHLFASRVSWIPAYDVVIMDEYQDLQDDFAEEITHIRDLCGAARGSSPQFLVVGDMDQKIFDYTLCKADVFIQEFLSGLPGGFSQVYFTHCFRLSARIAGQIGEAWNKSIVGVNPDCKTSYESKLDRVVSFLSGFEPEEILVLGANNGSRAIIQNQLEKKYPDKFNKYTVYSSIKGVDAGFSDKDTSKTAIFTTYDTAKGLERPICVVCDFTNGYLDLRLRHGARSQILKNMFLVAASRGKKCILFYAPKNGDILQLPRLQRLTGASSVNIRPEDMAGVFSHKVQEQVDECFSFLACEQVEGPGETISFTECDGMIDLSPCIAIYARTVFFEDYSIDRAVQSKLAKADMRGMDINLPKYQNRWHLQKKILYLTALETGQERYVDQAVEEYVDEENREKLMERLSEHLDSGDVVDAPCDIQYNKVSDGKIPIGAKVLVGSVDVLHRQEDNVLYKLVFTRDLQEEQMLQAAYSAVCFGMQEIYLWNLYDGWLCRISVEDPCAFLQSVLACASRGRLRAEEAVLLHCAGGQKTYRFGREDEPFFLMNDTTLCQKFFRKMEKYG